MTEFKPSFTKHSRPYRTSPPLFWSEPTLDEILADPIVNDLMAADGVHPATIRRTMARAAQAKRKML